jgi:hypothetical protein
MVSRGVNLKINMNSQQLHPFIAGGNKHSSLLPFAEQSANRANLKQEAMPPQWSRYIWLTNRSSSQSSANNTKGAHQVQKTTPTNHQSKGTVQSNGMKAGNKENWNADLPFSFNSGTTDKMILL